ncbi:MAG: hypothetical protein HYX34_13640 [Actinobacteria bacterium]|nr:hypothetical protein [Actinomycetota bacterium]
MTAADAPVKVERALAGSPASTVNEWRGLALLAGDVVDVLTGTAHAMHQGIADRAFGGVQRGVGPAAAPIRALHDHIAASCYGGARVGARGLARAGAAMATVAAAGRPARVLSTTPQGQAVLNGLNGFVGDRLAAAGNDLAGDMVLLRAGRPVVADPGSTRAGVEHETAPAGPRVAVLVHGLGEGDRSWRRGTRRPEGEPPGDDYAAVLERAGWTVLHVRYTRVCGSRSTARRWISAWSRSWPAGRCPSSVSR